MAGIFFVLMAGTASAASFGPHSDLQVFKSFTDTMQERVNETEYTYSNFTYANGTTCTDCNKSISGWHWETGSNTYLFDASTWYTVTSQYPNGDPKDVELTFQLEPTTATKLIVANKDPWKSLNATEGFNDRYYWNGGAITPSDLEYMRDVLDSIAVKEGGTVKKTVNFKGDKPKNITAKVKLRAATNDVEVFVGNNTAQFTVTSPADFDGGTYTRTTSHGGDLMGSLRLGLLNGTTLSDSRIAQYRFDGSSGTDYSGKNNDCTVNGASTEEDGVFSTSAFGFDGSSDKCDAGDVDAIDTATNFSAFVRVFANSSGHRDVYLAKSDGGNPNSDATFLLFDDGASGDASEQIQIGMYADDGTFTPLRPWSGTSKKLPLNQWVCLGFTYNNAAGEVKLYLDGVLNATLSYSNGLGDGTETFRVGQGSGFSMEGRLDEPVVWSRTLNSSEVNDYCIGGDDGVFDGDWNGTTHSVPSGETPTQLEVDRSNLFSSQSLWATVHNADEQKTTELTANGTSNVSLSFSTTGGSAWVAFNTTSTDETETAQVNDYTLFTASSNANPNVLNASFLYDAGAWKNITMGHSDPDGNEISSSSGSPDSLTNHTARFQSFTSPFDLVYDVTDFSGAVSAAREVNVTLDVAHDREENATGTVNESWQVVNTTVHGDIRGAAMNRSADAVTPTGLISTLQDGDVALTTTGVTGAFTDYWYWKVDNVGTTVFSELQDNSTASNTSTQTIYRSKQFSNTWGTTYSRFTFTAPTISGTCSNCGDATGMLSGNTAKNRTYNATVHSVNASTSPYIQDVDHTTESGGSAYVTRQWANYSHNQTVAGSFVGLDPQLGRSGWTCGEAVSSVNLTYGGFAAFSRPVNCSRTGVVAEAATYHSIVNHTVVVGTDVHVNTTVTVNNTDAAVTYSDVLVNLSDQYLNDDRSRYTNITSDRFTKQFTPLQARNLSFKTSGAVVDQLGGAKPSCPTEFTDQGSYCLKKMQTSTGENYTYRFYVNVTDDLADSHPIRLSKDTGLFTNWAGRKGVTFNVNGSASNVSLTEGTEAVKLTVGTSYGTSSLHSGLWYYELFYKYDEGSLSTGGGSGGKQSATFTVTSPIDLELQELAAAENRFDVSKQVANPVTVTISPETGNGCKYLGFTVDGETYQSTLEAATSKDIRYRVSAPDVDEDTRLRCTVLVAADDGYSEEVVFNVRMNAMLADEVGAFAAVTGYVARPVLPAVLGTDRICIDPEAATGGECGRYASVDWLQLGHVLAAMILLFAGLGGVRFWTWYRGGG